MSTFTVTGPWIHAHKTPAGGWTRAQVEALGISWPPTPGWIRRIVGAVVSDDQRAAFEHGRDVFAERPHR